MGLTIEDLGDDAAGRANGPGGAFRVPGTLPGERVRARVVFASKRGRSVAHPWQVDRASPDRVEAPCPHAVVCGGCDLLHARMSLQHAFKRAAVARALERPLERVDPVVPSPRIYGYRALAKLVVRGRTLGSYRPHSHVVQNMAGCRVHAVEVERVVEAARRWLAVARPVALRYLIVRGSLAEGRAIVVLVGRRPACERIADLARVLAARFDVAQVFFHVNDDDGDALLSGGAIELLHDAGPVFEQLGAVRQMLSPRGFLQVNPLAAAELYRRVVSALAPKGRRFVDLYAGSGGVSLSLLSAGARHVTAIENNRDAAVAARSAAGVDGMEGRLRVLTSDVREGLGRWQDGPVDGVVMNPPRKGAGLEVMRRLASLPFDRLVYVSCNPASLSRDLADVPFEVERVTPVDLFPHTRHVETILVARRRPTL